jgi:gamma-glutamyltranspeptidase/glutathione hydrolase
MSWSRERFAGRTVMPSEGWDAVTVPGAVSAWVAISARFGRLPFEQLFQPAIDYARHGFLVSPLAASQWQAQVPRLERQAGFAEAFLRRGRAPRVGELFRFPEQAVTLEDIGRSGGESFYRGALAARIASSGNGVGLTREDLAAHQPEWVVPASQPYRGHLVHEIPPNGQGLSALIALGILEQFEPASPGPDSADSVHLQVEAMKLAFADVYRYVSDPETMERRWPDFLDPDYLKSRAGLLDTKRARSPVPGVPSSGTVYLAAGDASGMMVSYIQSNFWGFGSGIVVPGTGISMQNRGAGFSLQPGHPNEVGPGKRPFHTIIPAFISRGGQAIMSYGVTGGDMQPQGHVQMTIRLVDYGQNAQASADAPRWKIALDGSLLLESSVAGAVAEELSRRGHRVSRAPADSTEFGSAQLLCKLADGYLGASEPRRDGQAVGF